MLIFHQAQNQDLPAIRAMYRELIDDLIRRDLPIWDDVYPLDFLQEDVNQKRLFWAADQNGNPISAYALCEDSPSEQALPWAAPTREHLYLYRLAINPYHHQRGYGQEALKDAESRARVLGSKDLRLLVEDYNTPAINLYKKCGYRRVSGLFTYVIDDDLTLHEIGFEKTLT